MLDVIASVLGVVCVIGIMVLIRYADVLANGNDESRK